MLKLTHAEVCTVYQRLHERIKSESGLTDDALVYPYVRMASKLDLEDFDLIGKLLRAKEPPLDQGEAEAPPPPVPDDVPPLKEAMEIVMGKSTMGAKDVVEALRERGWLPYSANPQKYMNFMFSTQKDTFERIERGRYRVRQPKAFLPPKDLVLRVLNQSSGWLTAAQVAKKAELDLHEAVRLLDDFFQAKVVTCRRHQKKVQWKVWVPEVAG